LKPTRGWFDGKEDELMNAPMKGSLVAMAAAGLFACSSGGSHPASSQPASRSGSAELVKCAGVNECKGTGQCAGQGHDCAGHNECKGQGWVKLEAEECKDRGGTAI
jgi:uncharacterized membrane protein